MDASNSFVLAAIAASIASISVVGCSWLMIRQGQLAGKIDDLDTKLPPSRVKELEAAYDALAGAFDGIQKQNQEFKASVHNSVQRLDQVMRRNEKASDALLSDTGELNPDIVAGVLPDMEGDPVAGEVAVSKQKALRLRWQRNRGV